MESSHRYLLCIELYDKSYLLVGETDQSQKIAPTTGVRRLRPARAVIVGGEKKETFAVRVDDA